ncbi:MAG: (2Fe-2S)-binding protein [Polaromonas sp.]|uniref:(2Fe-2S)-binding protein n=1 Tax=Polaromonas sp. TaxID=1869339 RepID=UPI00178DCF57|nr:(2Fe-2S)-binding protein [Polaromonas sp.]MBA3592681.1 (2Fe-2S)-binding protein [Polaromonas sp.]
MNNINSSIEFSLDGQPQRVPAGVTVAAALSIAGSGITRISASGERRAAFCGMGVCQECRVLISGQRRLACQTLCVEGMAVQTAAMAGA